MDNRARRVMVIDDDPTLTDVLDRFLTKEGFEVEVEVDRRRGLDQVQRTTRSARPGHHAAGDRRHGGLPPAPPARPRVPVIMLTARSVNPTGCAAST
ncbi:MAG: hypothetical protein WKF43_10600 [Acidimicrobiales bacterium]